MIKAGIQKAVVQYPYLVLSALLALSVLAATQLPGLKANPSPRLLAPDHPSRVANAEMRDIFTGSNFGIMVMLSVEGTNLDTVFNPRTLERIQNLTRAFEAIHLVTDADRRALEAAADTAPDDVLQAVLELARSPIDEDTWMKMEAVREALEFSDTPQPALEKALVRWQTLLNPVKKVSSLAATDNILARDDRLDVGPIYEAISHRREELDRIEREVMGNALFLPTLISNQLRNTSINLELDFNDTDDETEMEYQTYKQVKTLVNETFPGPETAYIAGFPSVSAALGKAMKEDSKTMFAMVTLIVVTCLFITFKGIKGVIMPLTVVLLSLVVTLGIKAFFQVPLNIITISLPVFVLSIGVADGIHIYSEYRDHLLAGEDQETAVRNTLDHLILPVVMTSLTTGAAFYAISITEIVQLHYCGLYVCIGALVAMVFSLLFIPALLMVLPEKIRARVPGKTGTGAFPSAYAALLMGMTRYVVSRPWITLGIGGALLALFIYGATLVRVDNNCVAFFKPESDIFQSSQAMNQDGAGSSRINFILAMEGDQPFKQPANLLHVRNLAQFITYQPEVGKVMGLTALIQRIHYVLNDQNPLHDRLPVEPGRDPQTPNLISQLLLLYENGGGDALSDVATTNYDRLNLPTVLRTNSSYETKQFTQRIEAWARQNLPPGMTMTITGTASVEAATTQEIVKGQITGLTLSILVVLIMLGVTFRNLGYTLIAMVPLAVTITMNFGVMGFFKIPLDIGSAIIASVVIGIGVDYSIHYLSRLRRNLDQGMDFEQALENTVRHSGKAIVSNALTVGCGFLALWFATLTPLIIMGWLITLTMVVSALSALIFLPVFVRVTQGRSPQPQLNLASEKQ